MNCRPRRLAPHSGMHGKIFHRGGWDMKCEEIAELLPDYLQEGLRVEQKKIVERHLESCAECRDVAGLWKKLALIPDEQPSAAGRERFEAMLQAYQTGRGEEGVTRRAPERGASVWSAFQWLRSPVGAVAWSIALVARGTDLGMQVGSARTNPRELALVHTLRYDQSVDVRLAARDALSRHAGQPLVKKTVVDTLQEQQSPLVQVALIDQLVEWRDAEAAPRLEKLRQTPNLNPTVRQRADWAISKLN